MNAAGRAAAAKARGGAPRIPFAVLVVGLIVGGLALLLVLNTASAANELRRHDIAEKDASITAQLQVLRNEVAASAAPNHLAEAASQLGMVPATKPAFLVIGPDGSIRVMGKPGAARAAPLVAPHMAKKKKPKPTSTAKSTSAKSSTSATRSAGRTTSAKSSTAKATRTTRSSTSAKPTPKPKPTPTPTPTVTLPGGDR